MLLYNHQMQHRTIHSSLKEIAYKLDKGRRNLAGGAAIGMTLGALTFMLFSKWLPANFFLPTILASAAIFGLIFGFIWPVDLTYHEFDVDPDNITPTERVNRLHAIHENPQFKD